MATLKRREKEKNILEGISNKNSIIYCYYSEFSFVCVFDYIYVCCILFVISIHLYDFIA